MNPRTSLSHPLRIDTLEPVGSGRLGLTFCPGKFDPNAQTGAWARDLDADLEVIRDWGATAVVTLMEAHELELLRVPTLGERVVQTGLHWWHLPIVDAGVPDRDFEQAWSQAGDDLRNRLREGQGTVVHCRGGLGRTGVVAARLLIEFGETPQQAITRVRKVRKGAVENAEQERYLRDMWPGRRVT